MPLDTTYLGNKVNAANGIVVTDGSNRLPVADGSQLTNVMHLVQGGVITVATSNPAATDTRGSLQATDSAVPFKTIGAAIAALGGGGNIEVLAGTYAENITLSNSVVLESGDNVSLYSLELTNGNPFVKIGTLGGGVALNPSLEVSASGTLNATVNCNKIIAGLAVGLGTVEIATPVGITAKLCINNATILATVGVPVLHLTDIGTDTVTIRNCTLDGTAGDQSPVIFDATSRNKTLKIICSQILVPGGPSYAVCRKGTAVSQRSVTSNVATITATGHGLISGDSVTLNGLTATAYNSGLDGFGQWKVVTITRIDNNNFTFPLIHADEATTADTTGHVYLLQNVSIYFCASNVALLGPGVRNLIDAPLNVFDMDVFFVPTVITPVIAPAGGSFGSSQSVTITSATGGASIYYTTDGSIPTTSSTLYSSAITVNANETVRAIATHMGMENSPVASAVFAFTVANPAISPNGGTFSMTQSTTITCSTVGASIYYTTDGSTPTGGSTLYTGAFNVSASETVKAIGILAGYTDSVVVSAVFTINIVTATALAWDPTATDASIVLSNSNHTATGTAPSSNVGSMVERGYSTGKLYREFTIDVIGGSYPVIGFCNGNSSTYYETVMGGASQGVGLGSNGTDPFINGMTDHMANTPVPTAGSVIMMAIDVDNGKIWFGADGTWSTNSGGLGDPGTGTNPDVEFTPTGTYYIGATFATATGQYSILQTFTYPVPAGFASY